MRTDPPTIGSTCELTISTGKHSTDMTDNAPPAAQPTNPLRSDRHHTNHAPLAFHLPEEDHELSWRSCSRTPIPQTAPTALPKGALPSEIDRLRKLSGDGHLRARIKRMASVRITELQTELSRCGQSRPLPEVLNPSNQKEPPWDHNPSGVTVCADAGDDAIAKGYDYASKGNEFKPIEITEAVVVRKGTVGGNSTVDPR